VGDALASARATFFHGAAVVVDGGLAPDSPSKAC